MGNEKAYKEVIDILMEGDYDAKAMIVELAKKHPMIFLKVYGKVSDTADPELAAIKSYLKDGKKIQAIREYRAISGLGLKESKDFVDTLETRMITSGTLPPKHESEMLR